MITVSVTRSQEREDVLEALRQDLDGQVPFVILLDGRVTDDYPAGWAGPNCGQPERENA